MTASVIPMLWRERDTMGHTGDLPGVRVLVPRITGGLRLHIMEVLLVVQVHVLLITGGLPLWIGDPPTTADLHTVEDHHTDKVKLEDYRLQNRIHFYLQHT